MVARVLLPLAVLALPRRDEALVLELVGGDRRRWRVTEVDLRRLPRGRPADTAYEKPEVRRDGGREEGERKDKSKECGADFQVLEGVNCKTVRRATYRRTKREA